MGAVLYSAYGAAHAALAVVAARQVREGRTWTSVVVLVLAVTLAYDNVVLVLGSTIGEGDTLHALSMPRFVIHAFVTPISIAVVVDQARRLGVARFSSTPVRVGTGILTVAMVALGAFELAHLELVAERGLGLLHETSAEPSVPIPAIVSVVAMIVAGWAVRRSTGWSTLFTLGLVSFFGSAVPPIDGMLVVGNLVEIAFVAALLLAELRTTSIDTGLVEPTNRPSLAPAGD